MFFKEELLRSIGAVEQHYTPGDYIFREGASPNSIFRLLHNTKTRRCTAYNTFAC
ncbi:hypothetical protein [Chryseobacterium sp. KMC2]|uniref:hypothetical protein n=1 Tax=Chryseobacterium sp. KMC2 TaxID=2800705 RepID=UPI0019220F18|nr:hypothetical protein [Chryseobacterium sp. KMC2]MBL3548841.1 hypothetical protein [Chryseobacterium sp. KMC2]